MDRNEFSENLRKATLSSHERALSLVGNTLKPPFRYRVCLNQSYDENLLAEGETIPEKIRAKGVDPIENLQFDEVVELLWLDRMVPEWVDVLPWKASDEGMIFWLTCCGRFTDGRHLYHLKEGYPPFHAPGVWLPPDWKSIEESGRFDLNWHLKR